MGNIYFVKGAVRRLIGNCNTEEEAWKTIHQFLKAHKYDSPYVRTWEENGERWYDVGSWSEFFVWQFEDKSAGMA